MSTRWRERTLPAAHRAFLETALPRLLGDARIVGVAAGGSFIDDALDEYSDLDLVVAIEPAAYATVAEERRDIAAALGTLLAAFSGEHVGEPRLLICLYDAPLLHVDLKLVSLPDAADRIEDPVVLQERDGRLTAALRARPARAGTEAQWIEDRFWTWVHYIASKIRRGELFETLGALAFLRETALGPLVLLAHGAPPRGVRRLERVAPGVVATLQQTVGRYDPLACVLALDAAVHLYRELRAAARPPTLVRHRAAEEAAVAYLRETTDALARSTG